MSNASNLTAMIDKLVTEKTFTMDALQAIQELKVKAEHLEDSNLKLEAQLKDSKAERSTLSNQLAMANGLVIDWKTREQELVKRELKVTEHEKTAAVANAVSAAYKDALKTVFAPNVVRQQVMTSRNYTNANGQYTSDGGCDTTTTAEGYETPGIPGIPSSL
jgi:peptidoglycan hydrolase CwlO-like protein